MINAVDLSNIAHSASVPRVMPFVKPLNDAMDEYSINTPLRQAAFLAQCCHESGSFYNIRELDSGEVYEGRIDLGNVQPGDGPRYKGRGLLQIRGRKNYELCGDALDLDLLFDPYLLEEHPHSSRSAAWYWSELINMNQLADKGDILRIIERLNRHYLGLFDRIVCYERAKRVFGLNP